MNKSYMTELPPETLSEIFTSCVPDCTPLFLGTICISWRTVVWSTPTLWSSVTLRLSWTRFKPQLTLLDEWLARSGDCPLSISIDTNFNLEGWWRYSPIDVMNIIAPYTTRWRHIDLTLPIRSLHGLTHKKGQFPLLRSIMLRPKVDFNDEVDENNIPALGPIDAFCSAPQLHVLHLYHQCSPAHLSLPWHQLTLFDAYKLTVEDCVVVFQQACQLTHCTLEKIYITIDATIPPPIFLPELTSLTIDECPLDVMEEIFKVLTAPGLRELVMNNTSSVTFPCTEFFAFLARSLCSLQRFQAKRILNTDFQLIKLLQSIPSLVELDLGRWDESLEPVTIFEQASLPKLKSFMIRYGSNMQEYGRILDSIIVPNARRISLRGFPRSKIVLHTPFLQFLTHASQSLQYLSIQYFAISAPQLLQHFKCIPSLVGLEIHEIREDTSEAYSTQDDIIPLLGHAVLPNLQIFVYTNAPYFDGEVLENILSLRWRGEHRGRVDEAGKELGVTRLSSVAIATHLEPKQTTKLSERVISKLRVLTGEGMSLSLIRSDGTTYL